MSYELIAILVVGATTSIGLAATIVIMVSGFGALIREMDQRFENLAREMSRSFEEMTRTNRAIAGLIVQEPEKIQRP